MVPVSEMSEEAHVKIMKFLGGVLVVCAAVAVALSLGLLLMGEVASIVNHLIKG